MKKYGWTLVELVACLVIMAIISIVAVSSIRPQDNKVQMYVYATISNLASSRALVGSAIDSADLTTGQPDSSCLQIVDNFTLSNQTLNCTHTGSYDSMTQNFTFPNGVAVYGLANKWQDSAVSDIRFKDLMIDIDGTKGLNKVGVDRFPIRMFNGKYTEILPVTCVSGSDKAMKTASDVSKYCDSQSINFLTTTNGVITYDIATKHVQDSSGTEINSPAEMLLTAQPYRNASCSIDEATAEMYLGADACNTASTSISVTSTCVTLADQYECQMALHKPAIPAGFMFAPVVDSMTD